MFPFTVHVVLGETKINHVNVISCMLSSADQEVVWLDISVNDALLVYLLNVADQLNRNH